MSLCQDFLNLYRERHSRSTQDCYDLWMRRFQRYCEEQHLDLMRCRPEQLQAYHQHLLWNHSKQGRLYAANSVDMALRVVRRFYGWALQSGHLAEDPTATWCLPRPVQPEAPSLSREQVLQLFNLPDLGKALGTRDQLILELLYTLGWGLQRAATWPLSWHPELEPVRPAWERYLQQCRPYIETATSDVLLLTRYGTPFRDVVGLQMLLRAYGRRLDLPYLLCCRVLHRTRRRLLEQETRRRLPID